MVTALGGTVKPNLNLLRSDILFLFHGWKCVLMLLLCTRKEILILYFRLRIYIRNAKCEFITGFEMLRHFLLSYMQTEKRYTMCCLFVRFEEVAAVTVKITVLVCGTVQSGRYQYFKKVWCPHLHGRRASEKGETGIAAANENTGTRFLSRPIGEVRTEWRRALLIFKEPLDHSAWCHITQDSILCDYWFFWVLYTSDVPKKQHFGNWISFHLRVKVWEAAIPVGSNWKSRLCDSCEPPRVDASHHFLLKMETSSFWNMFIGTLGGVHIPLSLILGFVRHHQNPLELLICMFCLFEFYV